ncbi:MAG: PD-(D/E)XK nuclease family protein [Gammaproteobacteria bacterium]|nr:PD-(D/E)XK nuclease family protein [Gammaproteobacteria bacterium]
MKVRFGLHRDGLHPDLATDCVGEITVGPIGFLRMLEGDLGIAPAAVHPAEEVALYRGCLADLDDLARFYHGSFSVDPVGVARTLLDWRSRWYLHGWDGTFPSDVPSRLADLAAVEALAQDRMPPCMGERLRKILGLVQERRTQVETVTLLDDAHDLPMMWRRLLSRFNCQTIDETTGAAEPGTDLGKLQATLRGGPTGQLSGDGSLVVLRAVSRDVTAQATAEIIRGLPDRSAAVAVATHDGIILDNAFERVGMPRAGFQHYSPFRAASQVLKLVLALLWQPLDPHRLLQFLIHPVSPLPWSTRSRLAEAVAAQPGIGGPAWRAAMAAIDDADDVAFWVAPERFPVGAGAPVGVLHARAQRCAEWLRATTATDDDEAKAVFGAAYAQAQALAATLERLASGGSKHVAKIEVDRLVDEVTRALPDPSTFAEAGHVRATRHPGNIAEAVDDVYWWDLRPTRLDLTPAWTQAEQMALAAVGVELPTAEKRLLGEQRAWLRPALNCRRRLVLVVHDEDGAGRHPLWGRIQEQLDGWLDVRLDDGLLRGSRDQLAVLDISATPMTVTPLPGKRRWWHIGREIAPRPTESYTSLAKAYFHPHEWILEYHAKLRSSRITGVADGPLLKGALAHRLFERFFTENANWRSLREDDIAHWQRAAIADLIEQEGAVLLENGRGVDRQEVVTTLERALALLLHHLADAGVVEATSELHIERPFAGGALRGDVDLLTVNDHGDRAVLDAKWGSEPYRLEEIENNQHLQLAVYGFMLARPHWPWAGYYIVTTGNVLGPDARFFPAALGAADLTTEAIWEQGLVTYDWRRGQFAGGEVEVNAGAAPDERSEPPDGALETRVPPDRFDTFRWLTGVEAFQ